VFVKLYRSNAFFKKGSEQKQEREEHNRSTSAMTSPAECLKEAEKFLQDRNVPYATICFCMVTGSVAYDLSTPSSDVDYLGVYVARSDDLLCIESPVPVNSLSVLPEEAGKRPDITMYELGQFLRQLVKGSSIFFET
jgi:hypothetical protein